VVPPEKFVPTKSIEFAYQWRSLPLTSLFLSHRLLH
jgi:hypothetical protein